MELTGSFGNLDAAPYGAYVMDMDRRVLFWNRNAKLMLGHEAEDVVGRQCYEVLFGLPEQQWAPTCCGGCLTLRLAEEGSLAPVAQVGMQCASGERKRMNVIVLPLPGSLADPPVLVHVFYERTVGKKVVNEATATGLQLPRRDAALRAGNTLTPRELEVVRLLAAGDDIPAIRERLHLSRHTVLNHIRHARDKLGAPDRLRLVLAAQDRGLV